MTQEDKELLLIDLCARLPYEVICQMEDKLIINDSPFYNYTLSEKHIDLFRNHKDFYIKPYLRPMSSLTEEENKKLDEIWLKHTIEEGADYLNSIHVDYRGLIPKGLALEAPKGMYKEEQQ